jgi:hypothetical protein
MEDQHTQVKSIPAGEMIIQLCGMYKHTGFSILTTSQFGASLLGIPCPRAHVCEAEYPI